MNFCQVDTMLQDFLQGRMTRDELEEKYGDSRRQPQKLPTLAVGNLNTRQVQDTLHQCLPIWVGTSDIADTTPPRF
jgi:hypothetical protein